MAKREIFSKINIKDYNNELEKIIERKCFSIDVKNLLLSMLYKIETSYSDYKVIKIDTLTQKDFIQEIFEIIENCEDIQLVKGPNDIKSTPKSGVVYAYNEYSLIYGLLKMENGFKIDEYYNLIKDAMQNLLNTGYSMDMSEIIRDFDGWSWNISKNNIDDTIINVVYQNIKYLINNAFLVEWKKGTEETDHIKELTKRLNHRYTKKVGEAIVNTIIKLSVLLMLKKNEDILQTFIELENTTEKQLDKMNDKTIYIQEIVEKKKRMSKEINKLDKIINNRVFLEKEFIRRNKNLNEDETIFSLSDLIEILITERNELVLQIKECNKLINPKFYIEIRNSLEDKLKFFKSLELKNNNQETKIYDTLILLQKYFLEAIGKKIEKLETKKECIDIIYLLRYYKKTISNCKELAKNIEEIKKYLDKIERKIITKGCKLKAISIISYNIQNNYKLISQLIDTKIINLNDIVIEVKGDNTNDIINIYEENIIDTQIKVPNIKDIALKYNKKIKLFI